MFTGIVEEKGSVRYMQLTGESGVLAVKAKKVLERTKIGDSIAVNGVCLTVTSLQPDGFTADVMAETIRRSSLGSCKVGSQVNLERAMAADGRFGGHIVSGHIDGTGVIRSLTREENAIWVSIGTSPQILHLIVERLHLYRWHQPDGGKSRGRGISGIGYPAYRRRNDAFGKSAGRSGESGE